MVTQWSGRPGERKPITIFAAGTALAATVQFERPWDAKALVIQLDLAGFSGTIDIQGRPNPDSDYVNIPYRFEQATQDSAVAQLSYVTITANRRYIVPNPARYLRVEMTRSAGTIEGYADLHADGGADGGETVALGAGSALIGTVGIDQTTPGTTDSVSSKPITAATSDAYGVLATTTRAANQTPYSANDVVGVAFDLGIVGPSASRVLLQSIVFRPRLTAVPAGMGNFRLALYNVTPPSALADNSPWTIPAGDQASFLAILDLGTPALPAAGSVDLYIARQNIGLELLLAGTHLFGYLVTDTVFTPAANSEVYAVDAKLVAL